MDGSGNVTLPSDAIRSVPRGLGCSKRRCCMASWPMQMWANVSPPGVLNTSHAHSGVLKAALYYIDMGVAPNDPEGRELYFEDPRFQVPQITFPGVVRHGVRPNRGSRDRLSIAMNIYAKE